MDEKLIRQRVHMAVGRHCASSGVQDDPHLAGRVLAAAQEGKRAAPWRHRTAVVLLAALCLALTATASLAWSLSREYFTDIARITLTSGDYQDWSLQEKRYMVSIMGKYGLMPQGEARRLSRRSEGEIDAFMLDRYAFESAPQDTGNISLTRIAWVEMGPYTDWDNETWVWYSKMMFEVGLWNERSDVDVYETPGEEAIPPEEAVRLAEERLIAQGFGEEEVRSAWRVWHYMTCAADVKREHMVYCVNFRFADGSERYVFMTPQGEPVQ